ncbi:MAG: peptidase M28, partial [Sphingomonadales bacterium]
MRLALLALLGLAACSTASDTAAVPDVALPAMPMDVMKEATRTLSSDAFEGRAPGTPGEAKTLAYLVEQFQKAGLQPGNNGSWFQDVPLVAITAQNVSPLTFTGGTQAMSLKYGPEFVAGTYRVTPNIAVKDSPVVFVGYGINAPEKGWNDYAGVDVKGKTVVILVNDPDWETAGLQGEFNGQAMTYYGRWTYKFEEAARQGAAAALIVHDTQPAAYGWNVVQSSWTGEQQVADAANGHSDQTAANGWIQLDKAKA